MLENKTYNDFDDEVDKDSEDKDLESKADDSTDINKPEDNLDDVLNSIEYEFSKRAQDSKEPDIFNKIASRASLDEEGFPSEDKAISGSSNDDFLIPEDENLIPGDKSLISENKNLTDEESKGGDFIGNSKDFTEARYNFSEINDKNTIDFKKQSYDDASMNKNTSFFSYLSYIETFIKDFLQTNRVAKVIAGIFLSILIYFNSSKENPVSQENTTESGILSPLPGLEVKTNPVDMPKISRIINSNKPAIPPKLIEDEPLEIKEEEPVEQKEAKPELPAPPAPPIVEEAKPEPREEKPEVLSKDSEENLAEELDEIKKQKYEKKLARRRSSIILVNVAKPETPGQETKEPDSEYSTKMVSVKSKGNTDFVLNKGKIIYAVLETLVNSDIGGEVTAMISQDVYSQSGKNILIPRGSRIFGSYSSSIKSGNKVDIEWRRIDLVSGSVLEFEGFSVNNLGVKGAEGILNSKYKERIMGAILTSTVNVMSAFGSSKVDNYLNNSALVNSASEVANSIRNTALSIFNDKNTTAQQKIIDICSKSKMLMSDKSSESYKLLDKACISALLQSNNTYESNLSDLMYQINSVSDSIIKDNKTNIINEATKEAYKNISETAKNLLIKEDDLKPNLIINQGKLLEIYISQDYFIPKKVVNRLKVM